MSLAHVAAEVDIVLDCVWGAPTEHAMRAILGARKDHAQLLDWVHIGSVGGPTTTLDGSALHSSAARISGSGMNSTDFDKAGLPELAVPVASGAPAIRPKTVPLSENSRAWGGEDAPGERTVIVL